MHCTLKNELKQIKSCNNKSNYQKLNYLPAILIIDDLNNLSNEKVKHLLVPASDDLLLLFVIFDSQWRVFV